MTLYLNFRGTFANFDTPKPSGFYLLYFGNFCSFSFKFELDVDGFGSRRGADNSGVDSILPEF